MSRSITKQRKSKPKLTPPTAHVISAADFFAPISGAVAFDIETGPLKNGSSGDSLLSAETARVAAIGYYEPAKGRYIICADDDEAAMLRQFWGVFNALCAIKEKMVGFNVFGFDLPFLMRRSWFHSVAVPKTVMSAGGRYWSDTFVDLMVMWRCGSYKEFISLDNLARFLGVGEKNGSGEFFYKLWATDRQAAIEYLQNDVKLVIDCADKMGVTTPVA